MKIKDLKYLAISLAILITSGGFAAYYWSSSAAKSTTKSPRDSNMEQVMISRRGTGIFPKTKEQTEDLSQDENDISNNTADFFSYLIHGSRKLSVIKDVSVVAPTSENINMHKDDKYKTEIEAGFANNRSVKQEDFPQNVTADSHPPTGLNISSNGNDENKDQIDQKSILKKAAKEGFKAQRSVLPKKVPADSHPPAGKPTKRGIH